MISRSSLIRCAGVFALVLVATASAPAAVVDTFDFIDPAWVTDRFEPHGFNSVFFDGDNRLEISIDDAESSANRPSGFGGLFYNTQGRQRPVALDTPWTVSGDVYVSSDMLSGSNLRRTDLWTRDSNPVEINAQYPIIGIIRNDPADPFNPNAASLATRWRVWDGDTANGWVDLGAAVTPGWHTLSITADGSSFAYEIDGGSVYLDATASQAGFEGLQTVFVEAYNFSPENLTNGGQNYSVYWDNVTAVPEPAGAVLVASAMLAGLLRRRRTA